MAGDNPSGTMLDYPTLLTVTMFISAVAGTLLLFAWLQNRSIDALGIWGTAYILSTVAMTLLMQNRATPAFWLPMAAFPLWIAAHGLMWKAARSFEGRDTPVAWTFAGSAVWLAACLIEGFYELQAARIMLASALMGITCSCARRRSGARRIGSWSRAGPRSSCSWYTGHCFSGAYRSFKCCRFRAASFRRRRIGSRSACSK